MRVFSLFGLVASQPPKNTGEVLVLTKDNFQQTIDANPDGVLVEYYAPWCGHCQRLEPEYNGAAKLLQEKDSKVILGKVDATEETSLASAAGVSGYPTLKWYKNGNAAAEYSGGRTKDTIVSWIEARSGPAVSEDDVDASATFTILFTGASMPSWYESYADAHRDDARFYYKSGSSEEVTIQHKGEEAITAPVSDEATLKELLKVNSLPLFGELNGDTFQKYTADDSQGLVWLLPDNTKEPAEDVDAMRAEMLNTARAFSGKMRFAWLNTKQFGDAAKNMLSVESFPNMAVQKVAGKKPAYVQDEGVVFDEATVSAYVQKVLDGKISPKVKSEPIPEDNNGPVKVVVSKNFVEEVFQADKDVLLEIYAPWCGHCKKLAPEYEKLGKKLQKTGLDSFITIAKMDGEANDAPETVTGFEASGYPTMLWIPAGSDPKTYTNPKKYDGERTAKGMFKWIKKNVSKADEFKEAVAAAKEAQTSDSEASSDEGADAEL